MKNILVTGGAGFVGSHVVDLLVNDLEYRVTAVVDKLNYTSDKTRVTKHFPQVSLYTFDIADFPWKYVLDREKVDVVINFAEEKYIDNPAIDDHILEFIKSNYTGVARIITAIRSYSKEILFIQISTDSVLGDRPNTEDLTLTTVLNPCNPYSATKAAAEQLIQAIDRAHNDLNYLIVRKSAKCNLPEFTLGIRDAIDSFFVRRINKKIISTTKDRTYD